MEKKEKMRMFEWKEGSLRYYLGVKAIHVTRPHSPGSPRSLRGTGLGDPRIHQLHSMRASVVSEGLVGSQADHTVTIWQGDTAFRGVGGNHHFHFIWTSRDESLLLFFKR